MTQLTHETSEPSFKLNYLVPQQLVFLIQNNYLVNLRKNNNIARFIFDECHLIIEWSSFMKGYDEMGMDRNQFSRVKNTTLTASANKGLRDKIQTNLWMGNTKLFMVNLDRPNIKLTVTANHMDSKNLDKFNRAAPVRRVRRQNGPRLQFPARRYWTSGRPSWNEVQNHCSPLPPRLVLENKES